MLKSARSFIANNPLVRNGKGSCGIVSVIIHRNHSGTRIADYYAGKSIFLTGGTGFLGKSFMEKLLYSCQDLDKIYVLIRQKQGQPVEERLKQLINDKVFNRVRTSNPQALNKLVPIAGDISEERVGINSEDEKTLKEKVSVVIHSAANVKFNVCLSEIINSNFDGTRRVMNLCQGMKKLDKFVYISTAYGSFQAAVYEERVYPAPKDYKEVYKFIEKNDKNLKATLKFIEQGNTYTFSKRLTENYVATNTNGIPTVIIRPSIVSASYKELPGWLDNWTFVGALYDVATGLNNYVRLIHDAVVDVIPVDYVTNLTLIAAAKNSGNNDLLIYNSTSSDCNPTMWKDWYNAFANETKKSGNYVKYPKIKLEKSDAVLAFKSLLTQKIPAYAYDTLLRIRGEEPRHVKKIKRIVATRWAYEIFESKRWVIRSDKGRALYASLQAEDKMQFPCDASDIDWPIYQKLCYDGVLKHLVT